MQGESGKPTNLSDKPLQPGDRVRTYILREVIAEGTFSPVLEARSRRTSGRWQPGADRCCKSRRGDVETVLTTRVAVANSRGTRVGRQIREPKGTIGRVRNACVANKSPYAS